MWGAEWSQSYTYAPSGDTFNHIQNHSVSFTDNNSNVTFTIYGNSLSSYSTALNGLQIETSEQSLKWSVPAGYIINVTSVKARAGSDRSSKLKLGTQTSGSLFWSTKEVECSGLSLGNSGVFTPIQAQSNRCFLYTLTITYTLKLDYTVLNDAISAANTAKTNLSNSTLKNYLQSAITAATNSKTDGSLTSPANVTAKANWLKAITAYLTSLDTAWGINKNNIPDAVYDMLHAYDIYGNPNNSSYSTDDINNATSALNTAIDTANKTTTAYLTAKNTTLPAKQAQSDNNNPSGVADTDITAAYTALESATTVAMIDAALATIKQFDTITFNNVSQIKVNKTATSVASAHNAVLYTSNTPSVISVSTDGTTLTGVALGSAIITAYTSTGNGYYAVAAQKTFTVIRNENTLNLLGNQTLKVDEVKSGVYSNKNSNASVRYEITDENYTNAPQNKGTGVISYDPATNALTALNAGTATLRIYQDPNVTYEGVNKSLSVTVTKYDQTISWNNNITDLSLIAGQTLDTNTAHASSELPVVYSSSDTGVLNVDPSTGLLTAVSEGTATITVSQAGNYKYNAATSITRDFTIAEKMQASFTPSWWEGNNKPLSTDIKVGTSTTIELTNIATDATFTISPDPEDIVSWTREGNILTIHGDVAGTTELTLSQAGSTILNGNTAKYTITVSRYANTFAVAAESKAMEVGDEWTGVVTNTGNNNTQVSYSTDGVATYDAENNKIIAQGEGSTTITFTQAATTDHEAKTIKVNVTVTKVGNTLSISLPTQAAEVGSTIALSITGKNNTDAIIGTITETKQSSSVNNGSDVITYANGVITACNAGTAKITFSQPATIKYTGYESDTYTITVSKIHNTITITNLNGGTATNTTMKYNKTASLTYSSTNSDTSPTVTRVSGTFTSYSAGTITSGSTAGTDIYEITQAETYKYEAGFAQFTVRVNNTDEGVAYVLYEEKEYSHGTGSGVAHTYQWSGPGETVYYRACRGSLVTIYYNLYVEWSADNQNWTECQNNTSLDPDYKDEFFSCSIPETARYLRFRFPGGGTLVKYIKDVRVTRKTYVEASSDKTALGKAYTDQTKTATFTVNYSSSNGGNINISSSNPHFVPSISSISVPVNKTAIDNSNGNNTSYICGVDGTQTFTVTYTPDPDNLGEESADITIGDLFHSQKITLTASSRKYDTTISRGSNTATATTVGGTINNAFAFSGTTTAQPSSSSDDDFYYSISHTQTSSVNNGEGVISYNPATNTITGLNAGTARLTIYQKKTLKYHATSQSFDFAVTKLTNNLSIALSDTELDVDGTATIQLTNDDSKAALTASYSGVEYTNEAQNRDGGLLSFDAATKTLTAVNAGTATVTITQPETYMYEAASEQFDVTVSKLTQTLTWDEPDLETTIMQGQTVSDNTATSSVGLTPVTYSSNNTASITVDASTGVLTAVATGANVTITASQAGNYKYLPASISRQFSVFSKMTPSFTPDDNFTGTSGRIAFLSTATITVTNVSSGEDFTITNGNDAVINVVRNDETITITGLQVGSTTLTLAQVGNDDYIAKTQTYTIEVYMPDDYLFMSPAVTPSHSAATYTRVFLSRTFASGYYSIALPFSTTVVALTGRAANADDWVAQLETVTYSQADGYTLHFKKVTSGDITANQPYILHLGAAVTNPTWTNVEVEVADEMTVAAKAGYGDNVGAAGIYSDWSMTSNFTPGMDMNGLYGIVNGAGGLKRGGSTAKLNAFSAYITPPAGSAGVKVQSAFTDEWGVTTYIKGVPDEDAENDFTNDELYDLSGRRIDSRQQLNRGIYVRGGRRVVVK